MSPVEQAVPHDAVFTGEVSGGQQDSSEPVTEEQKDSCHTGISFSPKPSLAVHVLEGKVCIFTSN